jgi:hypothetical protein
MHSNKSWDQLDTERTEWMNRALAAESSLKELGKEGALGRLGAQLDKVEIAAAKEHVAWTSRLDELKQQLSAKERENAALRQQLAARRGVRLVKAPRGTAVAS